MSLKKTMECRLCNQTESFVKIIAMSDFPQSAQFLPTVSEFDKDIPITLEVVECMYCGLVQLTNNPVNYYKDVITTASLNGLSKELLLDEFKKVLGSYPLLGSKALDIGAGNGQFVALLSELGLDAVGLEHNKEFVNEAVKKGLVIKQGYLLDNAIFKDKFDLITCNNFLEHQPSINRFLNKVHALMADNGLLYLSVPNLQRIINEACFYEFVADHLVYFSKKTLRKALEISGFDLFQIYFKNNKNDIVAVARKRRPLNVQNKQKKMSSIINSVKVLVEKLSAKKKRISVWGAGHRALALMALADLKKIDFVIDSAPFKQGRYTPLMRKKIIAPDHFFSSQTCDFLIIMLPGSLSNQVKNI